MHAVLPGRSPNISESARLRMLCFLAGHDGLHLQGGRVLFCLSRAASLAVHLVVEHAEQVGWPLCAAALAGPHACS